MASIFSILGGLFGSTASADYKVAEVYAGLRKMVFDVKPADLGLKLSGNDLWGVVMETGYPNGVVTLVALADGTVSIYFSGGGGIIGLGQHDGPHRAAQALLAFAPQYLPQAKPTKNFPLPRKDYTRFYLLTNKGSMTAEAKEDDLGNNRHALSPLFHKAHELIGEIRVTDEKRRAQQESQPPGSKTSH
jgi:hypothetical protein